MKLSFVGDHTGREEDVLFKGRIGRHVGIGLHLGSLSHPDVVLDEGAPAGSHSSAPISPRSRTHAWSPMMTRSPKRVPAKMIAWARMRAPSPTMRGGGFLLRRGRARAEHRLLPEDGGVADLDVRPQRRTRVDDGRLGDAPQT